MIVLGVTDTLKSTLQFYLDWIKRVLTDVEIISLSCVQENLNDLDRCDGLVLTGGGDIHPKFYNLENAMHIVHGVNESRDEFEFAVVRQALESNLPILGICRGMQVFNVALGGTMIPDVESAGYLSHSKEKGQMSDARHGIRVQQGTGLLSIVRSTQGEVNTNHHQAVERPGQGLRDTAYSPDGLIEGLEWQDPDDKPFLQLVQWHPERMADFENPLSRGLLERFINEVQTTKNVTSS